MDGTHPGQSADPSKKIGGKKIANIAVEKIGE